MNVRLLLVVCLGGMVASTTAMAAKPATFRVQISIDSGSLHKDFYKRRGMFFVDARITNTSGRPQEIVVWTQAGWSWLSDSPRILPGINALQNFPTKVVLKPGQTYSEGVDVFLDRHKTGSVTFRLGFVPRAQGPASTMHVDLAQWGGVFWSNAVTLAR